MLHVIEQVNCTGVEGTVTIDETDSFVRIVAMVRNIQDAALAMAAKRQATALGNQLGRVQMTWYIPTF